MFSSRKALIIESRNTPFSLDKSHKLMLGVSRPSPQAFAQCYHSEDVYAAS